jgi:hypothetical protein
MEKFLHQAVLRIGRYSDILRADLFIISDDEYLLAEVKKCKCFESTLGSFIDDYDIKHPRRGIDRVPDAMKRHYPGWNGLSAFVEVLLGFTPMPRRMFTCTLTETPHGLLPSYHVASMVFL